MNVFASQKHCYGIGWKRITKEKVVKPIVCKNNVCTQLLEKIAVFAFELKT